MKKSLYIFFIFISLLSFAQNGPNPFADRDSEGAFNKDVAVKETETKANPENSLDSGGGNPGDPTPIDDYLPLLLITAIGLFVFQVRKQKQVN